MIKKYKHILSFIAIFLSVLFGFNFFFSWNTSDRREITFSDFIQITQKGKVRSVLIKGQLVNGETYEGEKFTTRIPYQDLSLIDRLLAHQVDIKVAKAESSSLFNTILNFLPMVIWIILLLSVFRGGGGVLRMNPKRRRYEDEADHSITFAEVAGAEEAKESLQEIVEFLKNPEKFSHSGAKIPKGVLLTGEPGTGKTLLAKAVAGEAGVPFFFASGSEFIEMFVGVGANRVRELFETARKNSPCIIFIDEIDSIAAKRGFRNSGNDEQDQTLNQLLVELDGFDAREGVILIGATNRDEILDKALLRPGRFDRKIYVDLPNMQQRIDILSVYTLNLCLEDDVNLISLARQTLGLSGAHLANLVNEAVILAVQEQTRNGNHLDEHEQASVGMRHFIKAKDQIYLGKPRLNTALRLEDKQLTAYHEGAHAVMAYLSPQSHPICKVTIVPHERALGLVMRLPEYDEVSLPFDRLITDIRVALAGRIGEFLFLGADKITTGASSDIQQATKMAYSMVKKWGMSSLGMIQYESVHYGDFDLINDREGVSNLTREKIDQEIRRIIQENYDYALNTLKENWFLVEALAKELLEKETLEGPEVYDFLNKVRKNSV